LLQATSHPSFSLPILSTPLSPPPNISLIIMMRAHARRPPTSSFCFSFWWFTKGMPCSRGTTPPRFSVRSFSAIFSADSALLNGHHFSDPRSLLPLSIRRRFFPPASVFFLLSPVFQNPHFHDPCEAQIIAFSFLPLFCSPPPSRGPSTFFSTTVYWCTPSSLYNFCFLFPTRLLSLAYFIPVADIFPSSSSSQGVFLPDPLYVFCLISQPLRTGNESNVVRLGFSLSPCLSSRGCFSIRFLPRRLFVNMLYPLLVFFFPLLPYVSPPGESISKRSHQRLYGLFLLCINVFLQCPFRSRSRECHHPLPL